MIIKKRVLVYLLVFIMVTLPAAVLYYTEYGGDGPDWDPANLVGLDLPEETVPDDEQIDDQEEDRVNYYDLLFAVEKERDFCPGEKEVPEPEPVPVTKKKYSGSVPLQETTTAAGKEQEMVNYINQARSNAGLPALQVNSNLREAARAKSRDMAVNNYFSHNSPTYGSFTSLLSRYGISYRAAAENIAWNSNGSVRSAHNNLMNSSGHRNNILNRSYQQVGVGIHVRSDGRHYYTQLFVGN